MNPYTGGCLCGEIRYEITGTLEPVQICYCGQCRKAQGTPFASNIPVSTKQLNWISGKDSLNEYESSLGKHRAFCKCCGSPMYSRLDTLPDVLRLRAGTLDGDPQIPIAFHAFVDSKAAWWNIAEDGVPRFTGFAKP